MAEFLVRLAGRHRPFRGWSAFLLTLCALLCLPASVLVTAQRLDSTESITALGPITAGLTILTAVGTLAGLGLARSRLRLTTAAALGTLAGCVLALTTIARLLPPWRLVWAAVGEMVAWLQWQQRGIIGWPLPLTGLATFLGEQAGAFGQSLWWDLRSLAGGGSLWHTNLYLLLSSFLAWQWSLTATLWIYRRRSALTGLLPGALALALIVLYHPSAAVMLFTYLCCALWLIAASHLWDRWDHWRQAGIDYPDGLGTELFFALSPWILALLLVAGFLPNKGFWRVSREFWDRIEQVTGPLDEGYPGAPGGTEGLPSGFVLSGRPELSEKVVFYVSTSDPPPPRPEAARDNQLPQATSPRYWRSETLDVYTGQGWASSPLEATAWRANRPLATGWQVGRELYQEFELSTVRETKIYAANAPLRVDRAFKAWWRVGKDLAYLAGRARRYTIVSQVVDPTIDQLRSAPAALPPEWSERYLALPPSLPERVRTLSQQVTAGAATPYDRVRAIEAYLRAYTYTLDLPIPPSDRDLVDLFLFDEKRGFCDHFASAMVVMARSVGIPARLAAGYAQGEYDYEQGRWVVRGTDAHSWVEVFFAGLGWIEFEPTPARPELVRPEHVHVPLLTALTPPLPAVDYGPAAILQVVLSISALALLVMVATCLWRRRRAADLPPADLIRDRHAQLLGWGERLGWPLQSGQTATEYGQALGTALRRVGAASAWKRVQKAGSEAPHEITVLIQAFVRAQYCQKPVGEQERRQAELGWRRLRWDLFWLWLGKYRTAP